MSRLLSFISFVIHRSLIIPPSDATCCVLTSSINNPTPLNKEINKKILRSPVSVTKLREIRLVLPKLENESRNGPSVTVAVRLAVTSLIWLCAVSISVAAAAAPKILLKVH